MFFLRALAGLDGYLKAFGTVRNWHRLFRDIVGVREGAHHEALVRHVGHRP